MASVQSCTSADAVDVTLGADGSDAGVDYDVHAKRITCQHAASFNVDTTLVSTHLQAPKTLKAARPTQAQARCV
eukprot:4590509-Pleurochrysis_carterae.AAC.1